MAPGTVWKCRMAFNDARGSVLERNKRTQFEQLVLVHLDAAYNLARWLTRDDNDAQDVVQEACLRALRYFDGFRGGDGRAWLLTIVRHTCYTWLQKYRGYEQVSLDDELGEAGTESSPEEDLLVRLDRQSVRQALGELPVEFREVIILREMEGLSYKEIARVAGIPLGTVMSRLARARRQLQQRLTQPGVKEV